MPREVSFMYLAVGALFFGVSIRTSAIPIAAWLGQAFTLRAAAPFRYFQGRHMLRLHFTSLWL